MFIFYIKIIDIVLLRTIFRVLEHTPECLFIVQFGASWNIFSENVLLRGHILQRFESYLKNRKQFVQIKNFKSQIKSPTCGVPQDSILGPLLFILYINDLANVSYVLFPILFADDTSVYIESDKESDLIKPLNEELAKLNIWLNANKLTINIAKSHYMVFIEAGENLIYVARMPDSQQCFFGEGSVYEISRNYHR